MKWRNPLIIGLAVCSCMLSACRWDERSILKGIQSADQPETPAADPLGNPYVPAASLPDTESLGWSVGPFPDTYGFDAYFDALLPQARDRQLYLQDISARYIPGDDYRYGLERKSLAEIYEALSADTGEYAERNRQFVRRCMEKTAASVYDLTGQTCAIDLDGDSVAEHVSAEITPLTPLHDPELDAEIPWNRFSVTVNGETKLTFEYEDAEIHYLDLDTCGIILVRPLGYHAGYGGEYAYTYGHAGQVYQFVDGEFRLLGLIDGTVDIIVGEGRFTTLGNADSFPHNDGPVHEVTREYLIRDGKIHQVFHSWQSARTLWKLKKELPVYGARDTAAPVETVPAGSFLLVAAYAPDGWLHLISDQDIHGYIRMTLDENGHWDAYPRAMPGGGAMEEYFADYGGVAG